MDTTARDIEFDEEGQCNYCRDFEILLDAIGVEGPNEAQRDAFIAEVKRRGDNKRYDCVIGVSGGVDSSYALYLAVTHGLRPLAVHLDNGWNSELAAHNIANLVSRLGVDLHTHVIDWDENRDMQRSFFAANVIDIELLMDNAMFAVNFEQARKYGLKYILAGTNTPTEGMMMPEAWNHYKWDARNIRSIHNKFGSIPIRTHPLYSTCHHVVDRYVRGIRWTNFLDYFCYHKERAIEVLKRECGYRPYPHKHYESVFTRFYQAYILPQKFGVDKRRLHLSALVVSGQKTRDSALKILTSDPYPDLDQKREDTAFVLKKLGFSESEFQEYIRAPAVAHAEYGTELPLMRCLSRIYKLIRRSRSIKSSADITHQSSDASGE